MRFRIPLRMKKSVHFRSRLDSCKKSRVFNPIGEDNVQIVFDDPQRAITPGQAAVLYDGDTVLGGGTIEK